MQFDLTSAEVNTNGAFNVSGLIVTLSSGQVLEWGRGKVYIERSHASGSDPISTGSSVNWGNFTSYTNPGDGPVLPGTGISTTTNGTGQVTFNASASGVSDHGALTGLSDDDHSAIYPGISQTETISGYYTFTSTSGIGLERGILLGYGAGAYTFIHPPEFTPPTPQYDGDLYNDKDDGLWYRYDLDDTDWYPLLDSDSSINADKIGSGTVADARIASTIARDSELAFTNASVGVHNPGPVVIGPYPATTNDFYEGRALYVELRNDKGILIGEPHYNAPSEHYNGFIDGRITLSSDLGTRPWRGYRSELHHSAEQSWNHWHFLAETMFEGAASYTQDAGTASGGYATSLEGTNSNVTLSDWRGLYIQKPKETGTANDFPGSLTDLYGIYIEDFGDQATATELGIYVEGDLRSYVWGVGAEAHIWV